MHHYSIQEICRNGFLNENIKYVVFKNSRDVAYCKSIRDAISVMNIVRFTDHILSNVIVPPDIEHGFNYWESED